VLAVSAGLLIKSLWRLAQVNPGFHSEHMLTVRISPDQALCRQRASCIALYSELLRRTRNLDGVYEAAAANTLPLDSYPPRLPVVIEGQPYVPAEHVVPLFWSGAVTPDYFRIMGIPIVAGRSFTDADGENAAPVVIVSAATARRYWPGENPIGKHLRPVFQNDWRTVVGVAADVRQYDLANHTPDYLNGEFYMPYAQSVDQNWQLTAALTLIVRTSADPGMVASHIRDLVRDVNPNVPVSEVRTMDSLVSQSTQQPRSLMWLFVSFAAAALLLAAVGTYGVVSYSTAQRTFEIGTRVALGATKLDVLNLVLGESMRLVITGLGVGIVTSLLLTRMLAAFLYGTRTTDPMTFLGVCGILLAVALLAGYVPARRAMRVDPLVALRFE
jgi:putative ABC transport system permease protein